MKFDQMCYVIAFVMVLCLVCLFISVNAGSTPLIIMNGGLLVLNALNFIQRVSKLNGWID